MLKWLVPYEQFSYLYRLLKNVNQLWNIEGTCLVIDLLTKIKLSSIISSPNFKILSEEKRNLK